MLPQILLLGYRLPETRRTKARTADTPFGNFAWGLRGGKWNLLGVGRAGPGGGGGWWCQTFRSTSWVWCETAKPALIFLVRKTRFIGSRVKKNTHKKQIQKHPVTRFVVPYWKDFSISGSWTAVKGERKPRERSRGDGQRGPTGPGAPRPHPYVVLVGGLMAGRACRTPRPVQSQVPAPANSPDYRAPRICLMAFSGRRF